MNKVSRKVVILIPGESPVLTSAIMPDDLSTILGQKYSDHTTLGGLNHLNFKLGIFVGDYSINMKYNLWATKIAQNIKHICQVYPNLILCGPAVLYNDDADITTEIWNVIRMTIKSKKLRQPPDHVIRHITEIEQRDRNEMDECLRLIIENNIPKLTDYGKIIN